MIYAVGLGDFFFENENLELKGIAKQTSVTLQRQRLAMYVSSPSIPPLHPIQPLSWWDHTGCYQCSG